jgi:hypothetical protein
MEHTLSRYSTRSLDLNNGAEQQQQQQPSDEPPAEVCIYVWTTHINMQFLLIS